MSDSTFPPPEDPDPSLHHTNPTRKREWFPPPDPGAIQVPDEVPIPAWLIAEERIATAILVKPPHPGFWWSVLWCIGYLMVTQIPAAMIAVVILMVRARPEQLHDVDALFKSPEFTTAMGVGILVAQILGVLAGLVVVRMMLGGEWPRILALRRPSVAHVLLAVLGLPGMIVLAAGIDLLGRKLPSIFELDDMMSLFGDWPLPFAVLAIGVGPGIAEELWCRGFLGRGLLGRYGVGGGVLLTSLLFALLHMEPRQVLYTFFMGILLHLAYLASRSLWIPILMHVLNNSLAVSMLHLPPPWDTLDRKPELIPWYIFPAAVVLVAGIGWAICQSRVRLIDGDAHQELASLTPYPSIEYPRLEDHVVVVRPWPSLLSWCVVAAVVALFALAFRGLIAGVSE